VAHPNHRVKNMKEKKYIFIAMVRNNARSNARGVFLVGAYFGLVVQTRVRSSTHSAGAHEAEESFKWTCSAVRPNWFVLQRNENIIARGEPPRQCRVRILIRTTPLEGAPNLRFKAELPFAPPTGTSCWAGSVGVFSRIFLLFLFLFFSFLFLFSFSKI
jgi:hypothetical protein